MVLGEGSNHLEKSERNMEGEAKPPFHPKAQIVSKVCYVIVGYEALRRTNYRVTAVPGEGGYSRTLLRCVVLSGRISAIVVARISGSE